MNCERIGKAGTAFQSEIVGSGKAPPMLVPPEDR
jgi:hypothetical protein